MSSCENDDDRSQGSTRPHSKMCACAICRKKRLCLNQSELCTNAVSNAEPPHSQACACLICMRNRSARRPQSAMTKGCSHSISQKSGRLNPVSKDRFSILSTEIFDGVFHCFVQSVAAIHSRASLFRQPGL
jgi:hypothetical protein